MQKLQSLLGADQHKIIQLFTFIKNAVKNNGLKLIILDPRKQDLTRIAEKSLQFKPGADVALLNAMLNTIIEEGLVDRQYIEKNTDGYLELKKHVKDFTPEEMTNICGIEPDEIRERRDFLLMLNRQ